jgi:pimeloyl-ACP methyl ester carboxylesterase/AraC-like DNA-binding protein
MRSVKGKYLAHHIEKLTIFKVKKLLDIIAYLNTAMSPITPSDQAFLNKLNEIIEANIHNEHFGVEELSREMAMSHSKIHRRLKSINNNTINQLIREIRLKKAMSLLHDNIATVSEIAYKVGFGSPAYFIKCFHEYFGFPPGEVKKRDGSKTPGMDGISQESPSSVDKQLTSEIKNKNQTWLTSRWFFFLVIIILSVFFIGYVFRNALFKSQRNESGTKMNNQNTTVNIIPFLDLPPRIYDYDKYLTMQSTALKIHYRVIGSGPLTLVFIPGWTNPLTVYTKQFDYFRDKAKSIYIDLPGHGLSDKPDSIQYTMGLMADAIYDVVHKEDVNEFVAIGFSWAPVPIGQFELKHPGMIKKLVNLDGAFSPWPPLNDPNRKIFIQEREKSYMEMLTWKKDKRKALIDRLIPPKTSPPDLVEWGNYFLEVPAWAFANTTYNFSREEVNKPIGWTIPIMSIYSHEPYNMKYEQTYFPDAEIHVLKGSGHIVQWDKHEIVNSLIEEFVSEKRWKK